MAIYMSDGLKKAMLENAFRPGTGIVGFQLFNGQVPVSNIENIGFKLASNGKIAFNQETDFVVGKVIVNKIKIGFQGAGDLADVLAEVFLTGDHIKDFTNEEEGGIYRLKTFEISM